MRQNKCLPFLISSVSSAIFLFVYCEVAGWRVANESMIVDYEKTVLAMVIEFNTDDSHRRTRWQSVSWLFKGCGHELKSGTPVRSIRVELRSKREAMR